MTLHHYHRHVLSLKVVLKANKDLQKNNKTIAAISKKLDEKYDDNCTGPLVNVGDIGPVDFDGGGAPCYMSRRPPPISPTNCAATPAHHHHSASTSSKGRNLILKDD